MSGQIYAIRGERNAIKPPSEDQIQRAIIAYLRAVLPDAVVHHSPNGGLRTKAQAGKFKAAGVVPGWPDITILRRGMTRFMEVKTVTGRMSPHQIQFRNFCIRNGFPLAIVHSVDEAKEALRMWGIETREAP